MDIKSIKSKVGKIDKEGFKQVVKNKKVAIVGMLIGILLISIGINGMSDVSNEGNSDEFNYFKSYEFSSTIRNYAGAVVNLELKYKDYDKKNNNEKLSDFQKQAIKDVDIQEKKIEEISNQYNNQSEYYLKQKKDAILKNDKRAYDEAVGEEKRSIDRAQNARNNSTDRGDYLSKVLDYEKQRYMEDLQIKKNNSQIEYYLINTTADNKEKVISNIKYEDSYKSYVNNNEYVVVNINNYINSSELKGRESVNNYVQSDVKGYLVVKKTTEFDSQYSKDYAYYITMFKNFNKYRMIFIGALILGIVLTLVFGIKQFNTLYYFFKKYYSKLFLEIKIAITVIAYFMLIKNRGSILYGNVINYNIYTLINLSFYALAMIVFPLSIIYIIDIFKKKEQIKENIKSEISKLIIIKLINIAKRQYKYWDISGRIIRKFIGIILILTAAFILSFLLVQNINRDMYMAMCYGGGYFIVVVIVIIIIMFIITDKIVISYVRLYEDMEHMIKNEGINVNSLSKKSVFYNIHERIAIMEKNYKLAVDKQLKSERMKYELITNVSHDLKTPLTSVITYVDLLKAGDTTEEENKSYVNIIDKKAKRLKILIDDLFEVSKMSSGAVELNYEDINMPELLKQALGELEERVSKSGVEFRVNISNPNIMLRLDGKKTWRVFENLIGNAIKYSMPNTRIYIDLTEEEDVLKNREKVKLTIKNTAAYEMDFDEKEIFERFKRGDKSRNTEGSGLGLAIAKSIVELMGGNIEAKIDGDMFKIMVEFYKATESD